MLGYERSLKHPQYSVCGQQIKNPLRPIVKYILPALIRNQQKASDRPTPQQPQVALHQQFHPQIPHPSLPAKSLKLFSVFAPTNS